MGSGAWSSSDSERTSRTYAAKSKEEVFEHTATRTLSADLNPKDVAMRESRDSTAHPNSVGIAVFLDVTGSMGKYPDLLVRKKLPSLMETIIGKGTPDAHVLFGAIGDHEVDSFPFQVGQFEAEAEPTHKWITSINIEQGGGSGNHESYILAWYFALNHFSLDCIEKRGEKGFIFTIGDERSFNEIPAKYISNIFGDAVQESIKDIDLLSQLQKNYNVYHLNLDESRDNEENDNYWRPLLGQNYIKVKNWESLPETIATIVAVEHGSSVKDVTEGFDSKVASDVSTALAHYSSTSAIVKKGNVDGGIVKL